MGLQWKDPGKDRSSYLSIDLDKRIGHLQRESPGLGIPLTLPPDSFV